MGWVPPSTGGGGGPSPSPTVVSEITFGQSPAAGVSALYSRGDHTHGTPPNPTSGVVPAISNRNPGFDLSFQFDPTVATAVPNDAEGLENFKVSFDVGGIDTERISPSFSGQAQNNARATKTGAAGKMVTSGWLESTDSQAKQFTQQFLQFQVETNFTDVLKMSLLSNFGGGGPNVLPSPLVASMNANTVDPTFGAGVAPFATLPIAVTAGVPGGFGITATPGTTDNLGYTIFTDKVQPAGDRIEVSNLKFFSGTGFTSQDNGNIQKSMADCQRQFEKSYSNDVPPGTAGAGGFATFQAGGAAPSYFVKFDVPKLKTPTMTMFSPVTGAAGVWRNTTTAADVIAVVTDVTPNGFTVSFPVGVAAGQIIQGHWTADSKF